MDLSNSQIKRPLALVILDGWGYAPRTERNAIAVAHTPYYDEICRTFPMTLLSTSHARPGDAAYKPTDPEEAHLSMGSGRRSLTEVSRIRDAVRTGAFMENEVLDRAFLTAKDRGSAVHLIGLVSDGAIHSSSENLFALLRFAKRYGLKDVFIHCILDGVDVPQRTADIYVEALEIKLADIGVGRIATLCGRFFAMDKSENWERTARAYTMLVHAEGERAMDAVAAIRSSFLRGISDEFISPIILENEPGVQVATVQDGDLVVFFNHRADAMRQLVRSVSIPDGSPGSKPVIETVCLTQCDPDFHVAVAFKQETQKNALTEVLSDAQIPNFKITESARFHHLTYFFDGGTDVQMPFEDQMLVESSINGERYGQPESESFKITDKILRGLESNPSSVFITNIPAASQMAETGDFDKTVAAIQYIDTCLGGICEKMEQAGGVVLITASHGNCEEMPNRAAAGTISTIAGLLPFHYVDHRAAGTALRESGFLEDVAPTILGVLGIEKPIEMTGSDLRIF